jgi:hypothetical protein
LRRGGRGGCHLRLFFACLPFLGTISGTSAADITAKPVFRLRTADGATHSGPLQEIGKDWSVRLGGPKPARAKGGEIISLRQADKALPAPPAKEQVVLANGSRVPVGELVKIADDRLVFKPGEPLATPRGLAWSVPLTAVSLVWLAAPDAVNRPESFLRRLARQQRTQDLLLLRNGDEIEGTFKDMQGQVFRMQVKGKNVIGVKRDKVAALAFNTELVSHGSPKGVYGRLVLEGGCRLVLTSARLEVEGHALWGNLPSGDSFTVPVRRVAALYLHQGCATYLSDLRPKSYRHTPFLGVSWPLVQDSSVAGDPLRLGGDTFDKGLGVHSQSRVTYALPEGTRYFEATVGLDEVSGRRGRVRVRVLLDGKPADLGWDKELTGRDKPLRIRLDVSRGREITLAVDFGTRGDVQAHVNWADARLIK